MDTVGNDGLERALGRIEGQLSTLTETIRRLEDKIDQNYTRIQGELVSQTAEAKKEMRSNMDSLCDQMTKKVEEVDQARENCHDEMGPKVRALEDWSLTMKVKMTMASAAIGALAGSGLTLIVGIALRLIKFP